MRKHIGWTIALGMLFSLTVAYGQGWKPVYAQDRTFSAEIPPGWTVRSAVFQNFTASSPGGEVITVGTDDVLADRQSLQNAVTSCRQYGIGCQFQYWKPRLVPMDIVRVLFPHYSPSMQSVQIIAIWPVNEAGFQGGLVRYKFFIGGIPNEGFAEVFSLPVVPAPQLSYWTFVAATAAGPRDVFRRSLQLYANILDSIRYNQQELTKIAQAPAKLGEELRGIDREYGKKWIPVLGGYVPYACPECPGGQGTIPRDNLPNNRQNYEFYNCDGQPVYVPHGSPAPCPYGKRIDPKY